MGYSDLSVYGSKNHSTPNIERLAKRGTRFTNWISGSSICTPSRASIQTGRYAARTGCTGNVEQYRVIPTPSSPYGLDPAKEISIARALSDHGNYTTSLFGKWHLGIGKDLSYHPNAHGYDLFWGSPYTNAPMCEMSDSGISDKHRSGPIYCFAMANRTVVQQPLRLENFTESITNHAVNFIRQQQQHSNPWFQVVSYFHVHTPLFTMRKNRGRSLGGEFGDNVEEMDDSVGRVLEVVEETKQTNNTIIFLLSDNGPYQEEGYQKCGRSNVYDDETGEFLGRLRGGKGQVFEGGIRVPGIVVYPNITSPGSVSNVFVSSLDIFPTILSAAEIKAKFINNNYTIDGKDMTPVLRGEQMTQHEIFFHYCGFEIVAARVRGRFKVFWAKQIWYTHDEKNESICIECCNGANPYSKIITGTVASELCGCEQKDLFYVDEVEVYDMVNDPFESNPLTSKSVWPDDTNTTYKDIVGIANEARDKMLKDFDPQPNHQGAGTCTAGYPKASRQPCCPGCRQLIPAVGVCRKDGVLGECRCG